MFLQFTAKLRTMCKWFLSPIVESWNMIQSSFAAHGFFDIFRHIPFSINKPNFHFKGRRSSVSILQINNLNVQIKQFVIFQKYLCDSVKSICGVIMNIIEISYTEIKYIIRKFLRTMWFSLFIGKNNPKSLTQK